MLKTTLVAMTVSTAVGCTAVTTSDTDTTDTGSDTSSDDTSTDTDTDVPDPLAAGFASAFTRWRCCGLIDDALNCSALDDDETVALNLWVDTLALGETTHTLPSTTAWAKAEQGVEVGFSCIDGDTGRRVARTYEATAGTVVVDVQEDDTGDADPTVSLTFTGLTLVAPDGTVSLGALSGEDVPLWSLP